MSLGVQDTESVLTQAALEIRNKLRLKVFPASRENKPRVSEPLADSASMNEDTIRKWAHEYANEKLAALLDDRHVVVDTDSEEAEVQWLEWVKRFAEPVKPTLTVKTSRGRQRWYRTDRPFPYATTIAPDLEVLGSRHPATIAGSHHKDGRTIYTIESDARESGGLVSFVPTWLFELVKAAQKSKSSTMLPTTLSIGERDKSLTSLAGAMRRKGSSRNAILAALRQENCDRCVPRLSDADILKIANSVSRYAPTKAEPSFVVGSSNNETEPEAEEPEIAVQEDPWPTFPRLPGILHDLAEAIAPSLPYEHKALHLLTTLGLRFSGHVKLSTDPWLQPRFYSCMISPYGQSKSAVDKEVRRAFFDDTGNVEGGELFLRQPIMSGVEVEFSINSGPGLAMKFDSMDEGSRRLLCAPDEMSTVFEKARATANSPNSLFGEFLRLYEANETGRVVVPRRKKSEGPDIIHITDAHLAIIGSATPEGFERMWQGTSGATAGLQNRFVLSYSDTPLPPFQTLTDEAEVRRLIAELAATLDKAPKNVIMSDDAQKSIIEWHAFREQPAPSRILDMAKRAALVLAHANGVGEIEELTMDFGLAFGDYQIALKARLMPDDADGAVQANENRIQKFYARHKRATARQARRVIKPERYPGGFNAFERAFSALVRTGRLVKVAENRAGKAIYELD